LAENGNPRWRTDARPRRQRTLPGGKGVFWIKQPIFQPDSVYSREMHYRPWHDKEKKLPGAVQPKQRNQEQHRCEKMVLSIPSYKPFF
jgi:hypothetical protein